MSFPILSLDVGSVRIGVARSDPAGILALPVKTVRRLPDGAELQEILGVIDQFNISLIVIGLPRQLSGKEAVSANSARRYAKRVHKARPDLEIWMIDERLSSVSAHAQLREAGKKEISHRAIVDQAAAVIILEQALSSMRGLGNPAGECVYSPKKGNRKGE